ncbi:hypothetical protein VQL36_13375 [Chengkuizengella sp. SCS-71B]|uniref:hypothetical protein n=1 Tax=Chengkuizengella sp. SCS-71B TaxID=3115290 RepID=UPI0032C22A4A
MTNSKNFTVDHFIPASWGHGGLTIENVYPLDASLNSCKRDKNSFVWLEENREKINEEGWNALVSYIAGQNDLTVEELREFTFWCEANKRSIEQVKADQRNSNEICREASQNV